jgi:hypothetical protein
VRVYRSRPPTEAQGIKRKSRNIAALTGCPFHPFIEPDFSQTECWPAFNTQGWHPILSWPPVNVNFIGYYQWDNNWKLTGRVGVQPFGGARLLNLNSIPSFTQPVLRIDLDRLDDGDNRLSGASLRGAWFRSLLIN